MRVRRADEKDLAMILSTEKLCFSPEMAFSEQMLSFLLQRGIALVAEVESVGIVGFIMGVVSGIWGKAVTLDVHPLYRRMGIGRALMDALEREFENSGARASQLEVSFENEAALALYSELGYQKAKRLEGYYGPGKDAALMWKRLEPTCSPEPTR